MRPTCAQGLKEGVSVPSRFVHWESNRAWVYRVGQPRLQPGGSQLPLCGLFTGTAVGLGLGATYTLPRLTQAPRASLLLLAASPPHLTGALGCGIYNELTGCQTGPCWTNFLSTYWPLDPLESQVFIH